jgi:hypothetical protein
VGSINRGRTADIPRDRVRTASHPGSATPTPRKPFRTASHPGSASWGSSPGGKGPWRGPDPSGIGIYPLCGGEIPWHLFPAKAREEFATAEVFNSPVASKGAAGGDFATSYPGTGPGASRAEVA